MIANFLANARQARILRLLDEERHILLNGPLTALSAIVARRESAIEEVSAAGNEMSESFVVTLRSKAERNARLIQASLAGLKAGQAQIEMIETAGRSLGTYAADGKRIKDRPQAATKDSRV